MFRIVQLSDLHGSAITSFAFIRHAIETCNALQPDMVVLTGDFVSPDETVANALSAVALQRGCTVLFDEQPGADILRAP